MINYNALSPTSFITLIDSNKDHIHSKYTKSSLFRMIAKTAYLKLGKMNYRSNFVLALVPMSLND
jgi:hypothetical protein